LTYLTYADLHGVNTQDHAKLNAMIFYVVDRRPPKEQTLCFGTPMIDVGRTPCFQEGCLVYPSARLEQVYDPLCGGPQGVPNGAKIKDGNGLHIPFNGKWPSPWD
jgi:hypothetical protein